MKRLNSRKKEDNFPSECPLSVARMRRRVCDGWGLPRARDEHPLNLNHGRRRDCGFCAIKGLPKRAVTEVLKLLLGYETNVMEEFHDLVQILCLSSQTVLQKETCSKFCSFLLVCHLNFLQHLLVLFINKCIIRN